MTDDLGRILSDTYNEVAPMFGDDPVSWDEYSANDRARIGEIATRYAAVIEARVRAEVAEEIARKIEAVCARFHHGQTCECWEYSKIARSLAAGSSPDTTPERPKIVIRGNPCCGGDGDEASCEQCRPRATPREDS